MAPKKFPKVLRIDGVRLAAHSVGLKEEGSLDLLLVGLDENTTVGGVLTQSSMPSASVDFCRENLRFGKAKALIVNSGNANAFTGREGGIAVKKIAQKTAKVLSVDSASVFVASTGIIGEQLPIPPILDALLPLSKKLGEDSWHQAAKAIMTTDTFPKGATCKTNINGKEVRISGIAKGSGMIAPNMATMLAFIFTDAYLSPKLVQKMVSNSVAKSFNCITVDSDTSTNDCVLFFATGMAENDEATSINDPLLKEFIRALDLVCIELAHQIVCDGEGATKFISITVTGAVDSPAARRIAFSIANSPLVKTAVAGEDPNWGRIIMAIGKAGEEVARDKICVKLGGVEVARNGSPIKKYDEVAVVNHFKGEKIDIDVDIGLAKGEATVWTCDLTQNYVRINADYRS